MLTCKQFLQELDEYLENSLEPGEYAELQKHVSECPNCFVVCDTTRKTLKVIKGMECKPVPAGIRDRLMQAIQQKMMAQHEHQLHLSDQEADLPDPASVKTKQL